MERAAQDVRAEEDGQRHRVGEEARVEEVGSATPVSHERVGRAGQAELGRRHWSRQPVVGLQLPASGVVGRLVVGRRRAAGGRA
jgi:hypothetical protein